MNQLDTAYKEIEEMNAAESRIETKNFFKKNEIVESLIDFNGGVKNWHFWWNMAFAEIRRRYRRTLLGPFWTTLSLGIFIGAVGTLFSLLWKMNVTTFLPYFTSGYICWIFISTIITDSCSTFIAAENLLKQMAIPYTTFSWVVVARNVLVLAHHMLVFFMVMLFLKVPINLYSLFFIPAMALVCVTGVCVSTVIGLMCTRYRDIQQIISSFLQISLFVTPIFWSVEQFKDTFIGFIINMNPLYHYIRIIRDALLGLQPNLLSWVLTFSCTLISLFLALILFSRYQRKLIFWL